MNIELMKELEDAKTILNNLNTKLGELIVVKKSQYIQTIRNDFTNFFKEKGFQLTSDDFSVKATYGNLTAKLSHEKPESAYIGCHFVFDLNLKPLNLKEYSIILNERKPAFNIKVSTPDSKNVDLQKEIENTRCSIDKVQEHINTISQEKWNLFIKDKDSKGIQSLSESYDSMRKLLNVLVK